MLKQDAEECVYLIYLLTGVVIGWRGNCECCRCLGMKRFDIGSFLLVGLTVRVVSVRAGREDDVGGGEVGTDGRDAGAEFVGEIPVAGTEEVEGRRTTVTVMRGVPDVDAGAGKRLLLDGLGRTRYVFADGIEGSIGGPYMLFCIRDADDLVFWNKVLGCDGPHVRVRLLGGSLSVILIRLSFLRSSACCRWLRILEPTSSNRLACSSSKRKN